MPRGPETAVSGVLHVLRQACCPSWGLWLSTLQEGFTSHGLRGKQTGRRAIRVAGQGGVWSRLVKHIPRLLISGARPLTEETTGPNAHGHTKAQTGRIH